MKIRTFKALTVAMASTFIVGMAAPVSQAHAFTMPWKKAEAAPQKVQTIVIGVDGLSYYAFKAAQREGLFKEFSQSGAHVAPFPSMTDLSWASVTHTADIFGNAGRIKSVEATYFDDATQSVQGDPRDYYRRLSFPKYYMGAFEFFFNPYVEALMYFPTEEVPKLEIKTVVDDLIAAKPKQFLTGYIGAIDSTAHTQKDRLFPVMRILDAELKRLLKSYKDKGQDVEVVLVSDHGNIGRFQEGKPEQELEGVNIGDVIKRAGLNNVQQLKDSKDVAVPLMALGTWAPVYLKDRKNMQNLIGEFRKENWFDLAVTINRNNESETLMAVTSQQGSAVIQYDKKNKLYYYYAETGNALRIDKVYISTKAAPKAIQPKDLVKASENSLYPDAIYRLVESASERNFDFPDFILTLKDGYYINSSLGAFTKMYRTHGSLTASSSYGLMASNKRAIPGQIRSKDILPYLGIEPKSLFGETSRRAEFSAQQALEDVVKNATRGVETEAKNLSQKRIFQHISRFVSDTRPYFLVSEMKSFMDAFKFDPFQKSPSQALTPMSFDISKFDVTTMISPEDIGAVTDAVLTSGSVDNLMNDPRVQKVKEKVGLLQDSKGAGIEWKQEEGATGLDSTLNKFKQYILPAKRAVMKMYQMPYLLEKSIVVQEKPYIPETRDLQFARTWTSNKSDLVKSYKALNAASNKQVAQVQSLLKEAIKEAELEERVYPTALSKVYNEKLDDVTLVYVPGIYNSIFDREIFSLGLNAVSDEMGVRVITPPVEATCSSDYNAEIILKYLREDFKARQARGHKAPRYLIVGYSKGAVDTLHAFTKAGSFVSTYVKGFVAVAAPLHGSSILNTTDVPFALVSALSENEGPEVCKTEKTASKSITPTAMEAFWRKNETSLIGLTRYFSVTFESDPEDSHIFMKATKIIGQFDESNDGVVTVSSSKFPKKLMALDMGTIKADHLAGILSSRFNQKAFMKGLVQSMAELNVTDDKENLRWNTQVILAEANRHPFKTQSYARLGKDGLAKVYSLKAEHLVDFLPYGNSHELNRQLIPAVNDPASSYEVKTKLPSSQLSYDPYAVLDVQKLPDIMAVKKVSPATRANMPNGINIEYNHKNMVHFRMDHQFNYESRSPGGLDDNKDFGYITAEYNGEPWALMKSVNNSMRMTTLAYRFSPVEFSKMNLKLAVTKGVKGADPVKGKTGIDDSAFQVWFTVRIGKANGDRTLVDPKNDKVVLFGYYWGDEVSGETRQAGQIFENWYSNKNIVVATLPEAKQLLLNNQDMLGKAQNYQRNLAEDLAKAFPGVSVDDMEIAAITIQHDSNDAKDSSEAYFKGLSFQP
ncbi:alkaline phosphatase family protein [Bdellovibrio sp. HCB117]|uniref:alkaline phosphatase family protein n=1 Tax=Bdellovibrio sp. HCB117 TaxID=3394359 RepID=UPI0039B5C71C